MGKQSVVTGVNEEELRALSEAAAMASSSDMELEQARAKIAALMEENRAYAERLAVSEKEEDNEAANVSKASTEARWKILIEEGREQSDLAEVFVQVNGRAYQIKRGVEVEVPPEVIEVLDHAVVTRHIPVLDSQGIPTGAMLTRNSRRFPYQNFGKVIDEAGKRI